MTRGPPRIRTNLAIDEGRRELPAACEAPRGAFHFGTQPGSGHEGIPAFCELPNGELLCAFYAGKYELSADSAIYLTRLAQGSAGWDQLRRIIGGDDGVPRVNAVVLAGKDGALTCFYSNIEGGRNFEFARPCFRVSHDGGLTWGAEQRMPKPKFVHPTGTLFALKPLRLLLRLAQRGQEDLRQDRDDGDDNEPFDKGEALVDVAERRPADRTPQVHCRLKVRFHSVFNPLQRWRRKKVARQSAK